MDTCSGDNVVVGARVDVVVVEVVVVDVEVVLVVSTTAVDSAEVSAAEVSAALSDPSDPSDPPPHAANSTHAPTTANPARLIPPTGYVTVPPI
jgi:hypothetical protein